MVVEANGGAQPATNDFCWPRRDRAESRARPCIQRPVEAGQGGGESQFLRVQRVMPREEQGPDAGRDDLLANPIEWTNAIETIEVRRQGLATIGAS